jgi:hypothetical protein
VILEAALGGALVATAALVWRRVHERRAMQKRTGEEASAAETTKEAAKDVAKDVAQKVTKATASTAKTVAKTSAAGATKASELAKSAAKKGKPSESKPHRSGPRGLRVGDVLLYADTELWLAGSFELDEEGLVARVFRAPGNDRAPWVIQLDPDAQKIVLARDCGDEVPGGRVPAELPIGGMRLSLERRGHAKVTVEGELDAHDSKTGGAKTGDAKTLDAKTVRAEYVRMTGPGGRELLVVDFEGGPRLALAGERTGRELFDFLPGGDD